MKHRPTSFHSTTLLTYSARRDIRHLDGLLRLAACTPPLLRLWSMVVLVHPPAIWVLRQELEDRACNVVQFLLLYKELLHLSISWLIAEPLWLIAYPFVAHSQTLVAHSRTLGGS